MDKSRWEYKKFEDALLKVKYTRKIQNSDYLPNGIVPVVSQEETFISGYWDNRDDAFKVDSPVVIFGDHSRVVKYVDFDFVLGADGVKILKPINGLNARFFYHFLKWYDVPSLGYSRHYKLLKEIDVPIPSLSEQQHIVEEFDLLSSIIEKKKAQINELDNLAQSLFYEMFGDPITNDKGWELKTIQRMVKAEKNSIKRGPFGGALKKEIFVENGYLVYEQYHALNNDFSYARYFITKEKYNEMNDFSVEPGDIIISCSGINLGKLAIIPSGAKKGIINQALLKLSLDDKIYSNVFFLYVFQEERFKDKYFGSNRGCAIPNMPPMSDFKKIEFIAPPLALQHKFASKIEAIEHQKELIKQSIKEVETLFNSRMDYYFN